MKVIVPASYDPITKAHQNLIHRACNFADEVYVCVASNSNKKHLFSIDERVKMAEDLFANNPKVKVIRNEEGLVVDQAAKLGIKVVVRGLRAVSDFEYELSLNQVNRTQNDLVETMYLMTDAKYSFISSTMVRELASINGNLDKFVDSTIAKKLEEKVNAKR